jgi:hypothetical protein
MTTWFLEQERGGLDGARQRQHVDTRRARFSALAQASAVAPVVITSSITTTFYP